MYDLYIVQIHQEKVSITCDNKVCCSSVSEQGREATKSKFERRAVKRVTHVILPRDFSEESIY